MDAYLLALITIATSFLVAWLTAQFALRRFYREKLWERKAAAYTTIFEALHQMQQRFDFEYHAEINNQPVDAEREMLRAKYREIKDNLYKTVAGQTWVISDESSALLKELDDRLGKPGESEIDIYGNGLVVVRFATEKLKALAKADLGFKSSWWPFSN